MFKPNNIYIYYIFLSNRFHCVSFIGVTGDYLRKRVTVHNQQIRDPSTRMLKISAHFDSCARKLTPKYYIFPFY